MKINSINIFEVDENLTFFSENIHKLLIPDFLEYGINLKKFFITNVVKPDGDVQYEKFKELHFRQYADISEAKLQQQTQIINAQTEAQKTIIESQAKATKRKQEGYSYQEERGYDVAEQVAQNEAIGQFTNMGVGLGTMAGVGGAVGSIMNNAVNGSINDTQQTDDISSFKSKVEKLNIMKESGLISEEEFNNLKNQLISSIL